MMERRDATFGQLVRSPAILPQTKDFGRTALKPKVFALELEFLAFDKKPIMCAIHMRMYEPHAYPSRSSLGCGHVRTCCPSPTAAAKCCKVATSGCKRSYPVAKGRHRQR